MIIDLCVTPKMFFTAGTDLSVRGWVYEFEENVRIFKGHQHSIGQIKFYNGMRKLGLITAGRIGFSRGLFCFERNGSCWHNSTVAKLPFRKVILMY